MKTYLIYVVLFLGLSTSFSCKKTELSTYDGERMLYFSTRSNFNSILVDSVRVNFAFQEDDVKEEILEITVALMGKPLDVATPYEILIDNQVTTAVRDVDFEMPSQFIFPAGKVRDTLSIKIRRTAKMSKDTYVLKLELKPTAQFNNTLFVPTQEKNESTKVRIFLSDFLKPTPGWASTPDRLGTEYYLGRFTTKKMKLISMFNPSLTLEELYRYIDRSASYYAELLNIYLIDQRNAGTPVLEDDGTPMEMGKYFN